ncbi:Imm49 family immunity protein [Maribacter sp. 1_MG-2023]|uniref:Imm49 family immunity protein n=1 Tax=Maribacter sp. 1_MG-2023 TaxID=3062677 RepID=UPI0026E2CD97|nr:Imm49 family immunity protein [Maribacter sp. 1_MG-2023]MDO6472312.1 Imm49 family immunity protein [Maribacter sp. 1_MG-2023]
MKRTREEEIEHINKIVNLLKSKEAGLIANINNNELGHIYGLLAGMQFLYAIHSYFVENDKNKTKDLLNLQGKYKLKQAQLTKGSRIFEVARTLISNVAISDNLELINTYGNFNYPISYVSRNKTIETDYKSWVANGQECIYSELMLNSMNKDIDKLKGNLKIFKSKTLKKKMNQRMLMDLEFYENLIAKNKHQIKSSIEKFLLTKEHNYRNQHDRFPELISYPAIGYLKIAKINGFDIKIDNPLIPIDLLELSPLKKYSEIITVANKI